METLPDSYSYNRILLKRCISTLLQSPIDFKKQIHDHRLPKENVRYGNRLIVDPNTIDIKEKIKSVYNRRPEDISGIMGETLDEDVQFQGIIDLALLVVSSNKLKNYYDYYIAHPGKKTNIGDLENKRISAIDMKNNALINLIASLFILNNTGTKYKDFFSYGHRKDFDGKEIFVMDIPFFDQFCVHYGIKEYSIFLKAKEKIETALLYRKEKGQISEEEFARLIGMVDGDKIISQYNQTVYEAFAPLPFDNKDSRLSSVQSTLGIKGKSSEDIGEQDIEKICIELNPRESHHLGVKCGFSKRCFRKN